MVTVAIGALGSGFSTWITAHPIPFWILLGVGVLVTISGFFASCKATSADPWEQVITNESGYKFEASPVTNSGNSVGRDNSGPQISTTGGAIFGDSALKEIIHSLSPRPEEPPKPPDLIPSMSIGEAIGGFHWELVSCDGNGFCFDGEGKTHLSVLVKNERAPLLQKGCKAYRVIAHLVFRNGISETVIDRGYWMGFIENQLTFESPQTNNLLLGFPEGSCWRTYNNRNISRIVGWNMESAEFQPEERNIIFANRLEVEISIAWNQNRTLAERTAIIERQMDSCVARWKK